MEARRAHSVATVDVPSSGRLGNYQESIRENGDRREQPRSFLGPSDGFLLSPVRSQTYGTRDPVGERCLKTLLCFATLSVPNVLRMSPLDGILPIAWGGWQTLLRLGHREWHLKPPNSLSPPDSTSPTVSLSAMKMDFICAVFKDGSGEMIQLKRLPLKHEDLSWISSIHIKHSSCLQSQCWGGGDRKILGFSG